MAAQLIINADDFGLTVGVNRAIAELYEAGALTSATLMASGRAFEDAAAMARSLPGLGVGCHIVLVDGIPVSQPSEVRTLLAAGAETFRPSLAHFVRDLMLGRIDPEEIAREAMAQVRKLQAAGIEVTHADTHKHTHLFPRVARPLVAALKATKVAALRNPFEPRWSRRIARTGWKRGAQVALLGRYREEFLRIAAEMRTTDGTLGVAATGALDANAIGRLLTGLPATGLYELVCHPGYNDAELDRIPTRLRNERDMERGALLAAVPKIFSLPQPPALIHYGNLD